ncbi:MAG: UDP-N-acetylmuramate dehydrogenase [Candidatus Omnitrophota bacterium]
MNYYKDLKKLTKGKITLNEPLSRHTSFRIGGPAAVWVEPRDIDDLSQIVKFIRRNKIPFIIVGHGSNLLVRERGFKGLVIRLNSAFFKKISVHGNIISIGSGTSINNLIQAALKNRLSGCEFLSGIPGSLGGALAMNAGARRNNLFNNHYQSIGDLIMQANVMDSNGRIKKIKKSELKFGYRNSNLIKYIIISAKLRLRRRKRKKIEQEINDFLRYKRSTQELRLPSAGCVFKNPRFASNNKSQKSLSAGYLIDATGLKNYRIGGAVISEKHANYIVNRKNAKAKDVIKLMKHVQKKVKGAFNLTLEPEIKII